MREVAVGIILDGERVLACQRRRNAVYPLKWEFPGGKVEMGETPEDALRRELHEELEIEVKDVREFHRQEWVYGEGVADPRRDGSFRVFYFLVRSFTGQPINNAFEKILWVDPEELLSLDILEGNRDAIALLLNHDTGHHAGSETP